MIPETEPVKNHWGNNSATEFDFDFYIEDESQLKVTLTDLDGIDTVLSYGADYSINEIGSQNGSYITFPIQGSKYGVLAWDTSTDTKEMLSIALDLPFAQEAEYEMSKDLNKKNLEYSFDYQMRCLQILKRKIGRALIVPEGSETTPEQELERLNTAVSSAREYAANAQSSANSAASSAATAEEQAATAVQQAAVVEETFNEAMSAITSAQSTAVETIQSVQADAESAILYDKENALSSISSAGTSAVEACEEEVEKAKKYAEESQSWTPPLFTPFWFDREPENASFVQANYSWLNSGYVSAYNLLAEQYEAGEDETETVEDITVSFKRGTNKMKIVSPDEIGNIDAVYLKNGYADYYILDTENARFKLPRLKFWDDNPDILLYFYLGCSKAEDTSITDEVLENLNNKADIDLSNCTRPYITEIIEDGYYLCTKYSNGFCIQESYLSPGASSYTLTYPIAFKDGSTPHVIVSEASPTTISDSGGYENVVAASGITNTSMRLSTVNNSNRYISWQAKGWLE